MYDRDGEVHGYDLTYATMAAILKYPRASLEVDAAKGLSYKKIGYFQSEKATFEKIKTACGLGDARHPLVFLLEAADDIAYMAADIEDGFKKGAVTLETIREYLSRHVTTEEGRALVEKIDRQYGRINPAYPDKEELTVGWLRIFVQQFLIQSAIAAFLARYDAIMAGRCEEDLLKNGAAGEIMGALKALGRDHIYSHKSAVTKELAGGKALEGLLEYFTDAVLSDRKDFRSRSLYSLISPNFRFIAEAFPSDNDGVYDRLLLVTDFISGMTDSYAIDLYQRLSGIRM
jgi:dGTPase